MRGVQAPRVGRVQLPPIDQVGFVVRDARATARAWEPFFGAFEFLDSPMKGVTYRGKPTCYWAHELASDEGSAAAYQELQDGRAEAVPVLVAALDSDTPKVRRASAAILGQCGAAAAPAVLDLARCLQDPDPILRQVAAEALGLIGPAARAAVPALRQALTDSAENVRATSAVALQRIEARPP